MELKGKGESKEIDESDRRKEKKRGQRIGERRRKDRRKSWRRLHILYVSPSLELNRRKKEKTEETNRIFLEIIETVLSCVIK